MKTMSDSERVEVVSQDTMAQSTMWLFQVLPHTADQDAARKAILGGDTIEMEMSGAQFNVCLQTVHIERALKAARAEREAARATRFACAA